MAAQPDILGFYKNLVDKQTGGQPQPEPVPVLDFYKGLVNKATQPQQPPPVQAPPPPERGFIGNTWESFKRGHNQSDVDTNLGNALLGFADYDEAMRIREEYRNQIGNDPIESDNFASQSVHGLANMAPAMIKGATEGAVVGGAALLSGFGAPAAPAAAAIGSSQYWYRQSLGQMYGDLVDEGIDPKIAKNIAQIAAVPYAALELLQVTKIPGVSSLGKRVGRETVIKTLLKSGGKYGKDLGENVAQEVMQDAVQIASEEVGKAVNNELKGTDLPPIDMNTALLQLWETERDTLGPMGLMLGPGRLRAARHDVNKQRAINQYSDLMDEYFKTQATENRPEAFQRPQDAVVWGQPELPGERSYTNRQELANNNNEPLRIYDDEGPIPPAPDLDAMDRNLVKGELRAIQHQQDVMPLIADAKSPSRGDFASALGIDPNDLPAGMRTKEERTNLWNTARKAQNVEPPRLNKEQRRESLEEGLYGTPDVPFEVQQVRAYLQQVGQYPTREELMTLTGVSRQEAQAAIRQARSVQEQDDTIPISPDAYTFLGERIAENRYKKDVQEKAHTDAGIAQPPKQTQQTAQQQTPPIRVVKLDNGTWQVVGRSGNTLSAPFHDYQEARILAEALVLRQPRPQQDTPNVQPPTPIQTPVDEPTPDVVETAPVPETPTQPEVSKDVNRGLKKKPEPSMVENPVAEDTKTTGDAENDHELKALRNRVGNGVNITEKSRRTLKYLEKQEASNISDWHIGDKVNVDNSMMSQDVPQPDSGFTIIELHPKTKSAKIELPGHKHTQWVHIARLSLFDVPRSDTQPAPVTETAKTNPYMAAPEAEVQKAAAQGNQKAQEARKARGIPAKKKAAKTKPAPKQAIGGALKKSGEALTRLSKDIGGGKKGDVVEGTENVLSVKGKPSVFEEFPQNADPQGKIQSAFQKLFDALLPDETPGNVKRVEFGDKEWEPEGGEISILLHRQRQLEASLPTPPGIISKKKRPDLKYKQRKALARQRYLDSLTEADKAKVKELVEVRDRIEEIRRDYQELKKQNPYMTMEWDDVQNAAEAGNLQAQQAMEVRGIPAKKKATKKPAPQPTAQESGPTKAGRKRVKREIDETLKEWRGLVREWGIRPSRDLPQNEPHHKLPGVVRKNGTAQWDQMLQEAESMGLDVGNHGVGDFLRLMKGSLKSRNIDAEAEAYFKEQENTPQKVTLNETEIDPGTLIFRKGEWHKAGRKSTGELTLEDGVKEEIDNFDSVDKIERVVTMGDPEYDAALKAYKAQERVESKPTTTETPQSPPVARSVDAENAISLYGTPENAIKVLTGQRDSLKRTGASTVAVDKLIDELRGPSGQVEMFGESAITPKPQQDQTGQRKIPPSPLSSAEPDVRMDEAPASMIESNAGPPTVVQTNPQKPNGPSKRVFALPELVRFAKGIIGTPGKIYRKVGRKDSTQGQFVPRGKGDLKFRADIFIGPQVAGFMSRTKPTQQQIDTYVNDVAQKLGVSVDELEVRTTVEKGKYATRVYQADEDYAAKTVAHEIGHVVDYVPDEDMKRGNILGRLKSFKVYNKGKAVGILNTNNEIRNELKALTQWWRPFDTKRDKEYTKYRHSSQELYADALSVLFNNPDEFHARAPMFAKAFFDNIDSKPDVKALYESIVDEMDNGDHLDSRLDDIYEMQEKGEQRFKELAAARKKDWSISDYLTALKEELIGSEAFTQRLAKRAVKAGKATKAVAKNLLNLAEEVSYHGSRQQQYMRDSMLILDVLKESGATAEDLGVYMFLQRTATERKYHANPTGVRGKESEATLEQLRKRLGDEKYAAVQAAAKEFWKLRSQYVLPLLRSSGLFTDKQMEYFEDNANYATFNVIKFMDDNGFGAVIPATVKTQIGTLQDVSNVFTATVIKDAALLKAAMMNNTKLHLIDFVLQTKADPIETAKSVHTEKGPRWVDAPPKGMQLMVVNRNGVQEGYYLPQHLAEYYERDPMRANVVFRTLYYMSIPSKAMFTQYNPFWGLWNVQRDFRRSVQNLPGGLVKNTLGLARAYKKVYADAWLDAFYDKSTPRFREMYNQNILLTTRMWSALEASDTNTEIERQMAHLGATGKLEVGKGKFAKAWDKADRFGAFDKLDRWGKFTERIAKAAAYEYLNESTNLGKQDIAHIVRTQAGSPNFLAGGRWRMAYNNVWLFSNASLQGTRASYAAFKDNPWEWTGKAVITSVLPKFIKYGAMKGIVGSILAKLLGGDDDDYKFIQDAVTLIPERQKAMYNTIPFWKDGNNIVYAVFPDDFAGQLIGSTTWNLLRQMDGFKPADITEALYQVNPFSDLSPPIQLIADVIAYSIGKNPYDSYRGKTVLTEDEFKAGGAQAWGKLAKYELSENIPLLRFTKNRPEDSPLAKTLQSTGLGRIVRSSDQGKYDDISRTLSFTEQQEARQRIAVGDIIKDTIDELPQKPTFTQLTDASKQAYQKAVESKKLAPTYAFGMFNARFMKSATYQYGDGFEKLAAYASATEKKAMEEYAHEHGDSYEANTKSKEEETLTMLRRLEPYKPTKASEVASWEMNTFASREYLKGLGMSKSELVTMYRKSLNKRYKTQETRNKYLSRIIRQLNAAGIE